MGTELLNEPGDVFWVHSMWGGRDRGRILTFGSGRQSVDFQTSDLPRRLVEFLEQLNAEIRQGYVMHAGDCRCNLCIHAPNGSPSEPVRALTMTAEAN